MNMYRDFNFMTYNCRSINAHFSRVEELKLFLREHNICVSLLCETFLKAHHSLEVPNYDVIRTDSNGWGAGTAILVRKDFRYREIRAPVLTSFRDVSAIQIFNDRVTCSVFSVYVPNEVNEIRPRCINSLLNMDDHVIIGGDFNARHVQWGCFTTNSRGRSLARYDLDHSGVDILFPDSPTCYPGDVMRKPSIIDGFLIKNLSVNGGATAINELSSDHNPVLMSVSLDVTTDVPNDNFNFAKAR